MIAPLGQALSQEPRSMQASGSTYILRSMARSPQMQSTGHTATQAWSELSMHGAAMT